MKSRITFGSKSVAKSFFLALFVIVIVIVSLLAILQAGNEDIRGRAAGGPYASFTPTPTPVCNPTNNFLYVTQMTIGNGDQYTFHMIGYPCTIPVIKTVEDDLGKSSFDIIVNPSADSYLSTLLANINNKIPAKIKNNQGSTPPTKNDLTTIVQAIYNTISEYKISYYPWYSSKDNLIRYVTSDLLIGTRLKSGFYTCFEAALLGKTVLNQLKISTSFGEPGLHVNLIYNDYNGHVYTLEPLVGMVN